MYEKIGGQVVVDKLVEDFYHIMSTDPVAKDCFATHAGRDMEETAVKLKYFLSGWLGGPPLYMETYGHPRLRMRHNPFVIGAKESEQWLYCMKKALEQSTIKAEHQTEMMTAFEHVAQMLINNQA